MYLIFIKVPLNNKETMLQRQISIERDETETGLEALEEPLKARKRRESRQGIEVEIYKVAENSSEHIGTNFYNKSCHILKVAILNCVIFFSFFLSLKY